MKSLCIVFAWVIGGCGGGDGPVYEDANYAGTCASPNGGYVIHCESMICSDGRMGCASQPDVVVLYSAGNQLGDTQGWTVTTLQTTPNTCIRNLALSNTNGSTRSAIVQSSADGHHLRETFTDRSPTLSGSCTTVARLDWQQ